MSDRFKPRSAAIGSMFLALVLVAARAAAGAPQGVGVNGPLSLGEPAGPPAPPVMEAPPKSPAIAEQPAGQPSTLNTQHSALSTQHSAVGSSGLAPALGGRDRESASAAPSTPPSEAKPLGRPNSPLSVRSANPPQPAGGSLLERFDPRHNDVTRVLGALAVVVGLLLLLRTVLRRALGSGGDGLGPRRGGGRPSGVLEILARYPIARGQQLMLLKLARRIVLLHQSGSSMTALSEMTEPDEVAALLSRLEAGASQRDAARFRTTLNEFMAGQDAPSGRAERTVSINAPTDLPAMETEIIDLTRQHKGRGLAALLGRKAGR